MRIRTKLTILFAIIVSAIIIGFSLSVYILSANFRVEQFYQRLRDRANTTAKLLIDVKEVDSSLLKIIDRNTLLLPQEQIVIYNYLNEQIYNSLESEPIEYPIELLNEIRINHEVLFNQNDKEVIGLQYSDEFNRFVVIASAYDKFGRGKLVFLRLIIIITFFISITLTVISGLFYSSQALRPISRIINEVDNITDKSLNVRLNEGNKKDEISKLSITFNRMLDRLEKAFNMQKSFVSNASHELRTPLTVMKGQLEVALLKNRTEQEYKELILSLRDDIDNMSNLSNNLLDLAQASIDFSEIKKVNLRIDELLISSQSELQSKKPNYNVVIDFTEFPDSEEKLIIFGNELLLKSAIKNLMDNACKYSNDLSVHVSMSFEEKCCKLIFSDKGIGISATDLELIFEPFYRASNVKKINGHGLGLSLTKKIIEIHNCTIEIESEINKGTKVLVNLPYSK